MSGRRWRPTRAHGLAQTRAAIAYARRLHIGQQQGDGTPFVFHPLEVGSLLHETGAPDHLIAAGVLHDLIEKTEATEADLLERFGPLVTDLVLAVSDDDRIDGYAKRKAALRQQVARAGDEALALFAADKLSKLRELRREAQLDGDTRVIPGKVRELRARRLRHYQRSLALLEERLPESSLVRDLRAELSAFRRDRALLRGAH